MNYDPDSTAEDGNKPKLFRTKKLRARGDRPRGTKIVIASSHSGKIVVINADNGKIISETQLEDRIESSACVSKCGRYYFIGCYDGCLYKINVQNGSVEWSFTTEDIVKSTAVVYKDFIIFGSYDKCLYCIDETKGVLIWKTDLHAPILVTPQIKDDIIFSATLKGSLTTLDATSGKILWDCNMSPVFSNPIIHNNYIVVAEAKGTLFWFNTETGEKISSFKADNMIFSSLAAYQCRNDIYISFGCQDGYIYCLCGNTVEWKSNLDARIVSSPFFFSAKTEILIAVASTKGTVYILDFKDGKILANYYLSQEVFSSPIIMNESVVVGCRDDNLYFLKLKNILP